MRVRKYKLVFIGLAIFLSCYVTINYVNYKNFNSLAQIELALHDNQKQQPNPIVQLNPIEALPVQQNQQTRFKAYDGGGFGSVNSGLVNCPSDPTVQVEVVTSPNNPKNIPDLFYYNMNLPENHISKLTVDLKHRQYSMVYGMESEVHSYGGRTWVNADFRMYYNLDKSFPQPATYFDVRVHLADLLSPPRVEFKDKEQEAPIVWVVSNCNAYNGRETFMRELMAKIEVHSYGGCLKNKFSHPSQHMKGNIELFSRYKFAIAIENSNCEDYVTEKLVHAIASGSIPIVAGRDNKPDYNKFLPKNSFINIYDYKTVDELVAHINKITSDPVLYNSYMAFKKSHNLTRKELYALKLKELIVKSKEIIEPTEKFFKELVAKEKSDNKLCKIASYLNSHSREVVEEEIKLRRQKRGTVEQDCLRSKNIPVDFDIKKNVSNE